MSADPRPSDLLVVARRMLSTRGTLPVVVRSRAAAVLARQALEGALAEYWAHRLTRVGGAPARVQLLCARHLLDRLDLAGDLSYLWSALSRVLHHHPTDTAPTQAEIDHLLVRAQAVTTSLGEVRGIRGA